VGVLVDLSLILAAATLFPAIDVVALTVWLCVALLLGLLVTGVLLLRRACRTAQTEPRLPRATWRMPPLDQLPRPVSTTGRTIGLLVLRGYLILAAVLVAIKFVQLATGH
jgi:hypothetical protein